jgi:hypothetical protein
MLALGVLSIDATVFILASGPDRSTAQLAALAALHQRPVTVAQVAPAPPAATPAAQTNPGAEASSSPSDSSGSADASSSSDASGAGSSAASDATSGSSVASDSGDGSDTSTASTTTTSSSTTTPGRTLPKVGHVFEIVLSTSTYAAAFGHGSPANYLRSLESKGTLLSGYESLGEGELADELAMVSGQAPNRDTRAGCTTYSEFPTGVAAKANGTVPGAGCVYPETALTIGDQVSASGHTWGAYIEDMGTATCAHPNSGTADDLALTGTGTGYDTRHNPFIYFHSLLDLGDCQSDDVDLRPPRQGASARSRTGTFTFVAPGVRRRHCGGGHGSATDAPATRGSETSTTGTTTAPVTTSTTTSTTSTGTGTGAATSSESASAQPGGSVGCASDQPVGIAAEDAFLKQWVPRILRSPAYRKDGVLIVTFAGDAAKNPGRPTRTGALVLSRYARRHHTLTATYGPYSLLRSVEDMLHYSALARAKSAPSFAAAALAAN